MAAFQRDIFGGEQEWTAPYEPDPEMVRRLTRRDVNREMRNLGATRHGAIRSRPADAPGEVIKAETRDLGLPVARTRKIAPPEPFHPFDHVAWRRMGTYKEIPVEGLHTAQTQVDVRRVAELQKDPSLGRNPRLPDEMPHVLNTMVHRPGKGGIGGGMEKTHVVINGNHRVVAEIGKGAMFVPARVVEDTQDNRARATEIEYQRGGLDQSAEGSRMLREGTLTGVPADRTRAFVEGQRAAYRNA